MERIRRVQERLVLVHLGLMVRLLDYRQVSISRACECLVRVHLHPFVIVLQAVGVAGVAQQVSVHHRLIDGVVDVGFVVRASFGEVHVTWAEEIPRADVDGRLFVLLVLFLFPV